MTREMKVDFVPVSKVKVEPSYQRNLNRNRVEKIAASWDDEKAGALILAAVNGSFNVIDGQHRLEAAKLAKITDLPAVIFYGSDTKRQAGVFVGVNKDRNALSSGQLFRANLVAGDPIAIGIDDILRKLDYNSYFTAYSALIKVYERNGKDFAHALLSTLSRAWPDEVKIEAPILLGADIFYRYSKNLGFTFDWDQFQKGLSNYTQRYIVQLARDTDGFNVNRVLATAMIMMKLYNKGLRPGHSLRVPVPRSTGSLNRIATVAPVNKINQKTVVKLNGKKTSAKLKRPQSTKPLTYSTR